MVLSATLSPQAKPMDAELVQVKHFFDYCATHEYALMTNRKGNMMLTVHSDAGYLNECNAHSKASGHL